MGQLRMACRQRRQPAVAQQRRRQRPQGYANSGARRLVDPIIVFSSGRRSPAAAERHAAPHGNGTAWDVTLSPRQACPAFASNRACLWQDSFSGQASSSPSHARGHAAGPPAGLAPSPRIVGSAAGRSRSETASTALPPLLLPPPPAAAATTRPPLAIFPFHAHCHRFPTFPFQAELRAILGDRLTTAHSALEQHGRDESFHRPVAPQVHLSAAGGPSCRRYFATDARSAAAWLLVAACIAVGASSAASLALSPQHGTPQHCPDCSRP